MMELAQALTALDRALARARELGIRVSCSIADDAGQEILSARMDGAPVFTVHVARSKARTAVTFGMDTAAVAQLDRDHPALLSLVAETVPFTLTTLGGGVVVRDGGVLVGAVACSGATPEQDAECARAGGSALSG